MIDGRRCGGLDAVLFRADTLAETLGRRSLGRCKLIWQPCTDLAGLIVRIASRLHTARCCCGDDGFSLVLETRKDDRNCRHLGVTIRIEALLFALGRCTRCSRRSDSFEKLAQTHGHQECPELKETTRLNSNSMATCSSR